MSASPHTIITASAGTGKTERLALRYLRLLQRENGDPSTILALTFTRVAAGEMLERICTLLAHAAYDDSKAATLSQRLSEDGAPVTLTTKEAGALLQKMLAHMPQVRIATLDSFLLQIVRCFAWELQMPLHSEPLDEADVAALTLESVGRVYSAVHGNKNETRVFTEMFKALSRDSAARSVEERLCRVCEGPYTTFMRTRGERTPWETFPSLKKPLFSDVAHMRIFQKEIFDEIGPQRSVEKLQSQVARVRKGDWATVYDMTPVLNACEGKETFCKWTFSADDVKELQTLGAYACAALVHEACTMTSAIYDVLAQYDTALRTAKAQHESCTFDDITRAVARAAETLYDHDIFYRLDGRITHILIDEMQDTSWEQWTALFPLVDEIISDTSGTRSFFAVGDVKQAIYGWRGGAAELLPHISAHYTDGVETHALAQSWRTGPHILSVVNTLFTADNDTEYGQHLRDWRTFTAFEAHTSAEPVAHKRPGYFSLRVVPGKNNEMAEAVTLLSTLRPWEKGLKTALIFRTNRDADEMLTLLRTAGIPCFIQGKSRLFDNPAVQAVLALLLWVDSPWDAVSAFHVRTSFLGDDIPSAAAEAAAYLARVRNELLTHSYAVWLERRLRNYLPHIPAEHQRRLHRLIDLAAAYQPRATARPRDFVAWVEKVHQSEPPAAEGVVCTTMHNAKGKTYDIVVLPRMTDNPNRTPLADVALYTREEVRIPLHEPEITCVLQAPRKEKHVADFHADFAAMRQAAEEKKWREYFNVMYVALTRASHALYVIRPEKPEANTFANWMSDILPYQESCDDILAKENPHIQGHVHYQEGNPLWYQQQETRHTPQTPEDTPHAPLSSFFTRDASRHRHHVIPSHHALPDDIGQYFTAHSREAARRGTALHTLFMHIAWLDHTPDNAWITAHVERVLRREDEAFRADVSEAFRHALAQPDVMHVFTCPKDACTVRTEMPFSCVIDDAMVHGVCDRVVCYPDDKAPTRIEIYDFKSDAIKHPRDLAACNARYARQMSLYRTALARGYNLSLDAVTASCVYLCRENSI